MGLLNFLNPVSGGASAAESLMEGAGTLAVKIREAIKGKELDPNVAADLEKLAVQAESLRDAGQTAIDLEDAKSNKWWQAGWRPAIGWICGGVIAYTYLAQPMASFALRVAAWAGWLTAGQATTFPVFPALDTGAVIQLLIGMLGLAGMRTLEKVKGVN